MANLGGSVYGLNRNEVQSRAPAQNQTLRRGRVGSRLLSRRTTPDDIGAKAPRGMSRAEFERELRTLIENAKRDLNALITARTKAAGKVKRP